MSNDLTIIISHPEDHTYLHHCVEIVERLKLGAPIWIDGYKSIANEYEGKYKISTHSTPHGARCYDLLQEAPTNKVIIVDSDFFCTDKAFWKLAIEKIETDAIASIASYWFLSTLLVSSTPFMAYNKKEVFRLAPLRDIWNHFAHIFPTLLDPVFDHTKFVSLIAEKANKLALIDYWDRTRRIHHFCHMWDSRESYESNFEAFEKDETPDFDKCVYLAHGLSKYLFHYVAGVTQDLNDRYGLLMERSRNYGDGKLYKKYFEDTLLGLDKEISFKPEWIIRLKEFKRFYSV